MATALLRPLPLPENALDLHTPSFMLSLSKHTAASPSTDSGRTESFESAALPFSGSVSRRSKGQESAAATYAQQRTVRWGMSVKQLQEWQRKAAPPVLVDIRAKEAFDQFRMAGSLNIPLFGIHTKGFLRHRPFVLVDEGANPQALDAACDKLQQAGFSAQFLYGGLNAWRRVGLSLDGERFAQRVLSRLSPQQFREGRENRTWLVIAMTDGPVPEFPGAIVLPGQEHPARACRRIESMVASMTTPSDLFSVVIISQYGDENDDLDTRLTHSDFPALFFLKGGIHAYQAFVT